MNDTLRKDFVSLNKQYLFLVRLLASQHQCAEVLSGISGEALELIKGCTFQEIEAIAESMPTPCFHFKEPELAAAIKLDDKSRRAYLTSVRLEGGK